jgi:phage-related protein
MLNKWKIIYFEDENSKSEIFDFIENLDKNDQAKILSWFSILQEKGPLLPRPYADLLIDGIHELRIKLKGNQIRILYFFCYKKFIVLTHSFIKHTNKVPGKEIQKAKLIRSNFINRFNENFFKGEKK